MTNHRHIFLPLKGLFRKAENTEDDVYGSICTREGFQDVITLSISHWYSKPFDVQTVYCEDDAQEELIELQIDSEVTMQYRFHGKKVCGIIKVY